MFPTRRELSTVRCPKGADCTLGAPSCPFDHAHPERDTLPPPGHFGAGKRTAEDAAEATTAKRTKKSPREDTATGPTNDESTCPRLPLDQHSRVPWRMRQTSLANIFTALKSGPEALRTESELYQRSQTKQAYSSNYASLILKLRLHGTALPTAPPTRPIPVDQLREATHSRQLLSENGYLFTSEDIQRAREARGIRDNSHLCDRCRTRFVPSAYYEQAQGERQPCRYHFGPKAKLGGQRLHSCCHRAVGEPGCTMAPSHVFSTIPPLAEFAALAHWPRLPHQRPVVALDAEMIYTTEGQFPARISVIDWHGKPVLDLLVRPSVPIVDFNTRYSGISAEDLRAGNDRVIAHADLGQRLESVIGPDTILIGHSLENDMLALRLIPDQVLDTAILFPHPLRQEAKQGLKALSLRHLEEFIQEGSSGHCSIQDALTCLRLVKSKLNFS